MFRRLGMAADSESSDEGAEHTPPVPSGSSERPGGQGQGTVPASSRLSYEAETAGGLLRSKETGPQDGRDSTWLRREQPSAAAAAAAPEQRDWIRISGRPEIMETFRTELRAMEPGARIFVPAVVRAGTTRVHQVSCTLVCPSQRSTHVLCPNCTACQNRDDKLVADSELTLHSRLSCESLTEVSAGKLMGWCSICWFGGLGAASNVVAGEDDDIEDLQESSSTPDEGASDPASADEDSRVGNAGG